MSQSASQKKRRVTVVNASPRKKWITAQILRSAYQGAVDAGAETEYVDLYDLTFSGCRSCLACKRKGIANPCKCYWKDDLAPLLERIYNTDSLIVGTPIYFGEPTAGFRALFERLIFPALSYNDYSTQFQGKIDTTVFLPMNAPQEYYDFYYVDRMNLFFDPMRFLNGKTELIPVCDTMQVDDYSKYDMQGFDGDHKKTRHEKEFPKLLDLAYRIGAGTR